MAEKLQNLDKLVAEAEANRVEGEPEDKWRPTKAEEDGRAPIRKAKVDHLDCLLQKIADAEQEKSALKEAVRERRELLAELQGKNEQYLAEAKNLEEP